MEAQEDTSETDTEGSDFKIKQDEGNKIHDLVRCDKMCVSHVGKSSLVGGIIH